MKTIALIARRPGLLVLNDTLLKHPAIQLVRIITHGHLTKAEGGGERPELPNFRDISEKHNIPLDVLDGVGARNIEGHLKSMEFDLLFSLSWRHIVPGITLRQARCAAINIHRGDLPRYAGAEPVRRAIEAGETRMAITAHRMVEEIDAGEHLAKVWYNIAPRPSGVSADRHAENVKCEIEPLYAPLAWLSIDAVLA